MTEAAPRTRFMTCTAQGDFQENTRRWIIVRHLVPRAWVLEAYITEVDGDTIIRMETDQDLETLRAELQRYPSCRSFAETLQHANNPIALPAGEDRDEINWHRASMGLPPLEETEAAWVRGGRRR